MTQASNYFCIPQTIPMFGVYFKRQPSWHSPCMIVAWAVPWHDEAGPIVAMPVIAGLSDNWTGEDGVNVADEYFATRIEAQAYCDRLNG